MNQEPAAISPQPKGLTALFIHLAGADPKAFRFLAPHEATDYSKMGVTVLVPFLLALGAGSFTLLTLQDTAQQNIPMAVAFGVIWALAILAIDVAIMSQLTKDVPAPPPPQVTNNRLGPRMQKDAAPPSVYRPSGGKNFFIAIVRIMIAVCLGTLMSHCLVLAIFRDSVKQQVIADRAGGLEEIHAKYQPELLAAEKNLADHRRVSAINEDNVFLSEYGKIKSTIQLDAEGNPMPAITANEDPRLAAKKAERQEIQTKFNDERSRLEIEISAADDKIRLYKRDITTGRYFRENEKKGTATDAFKFESPEFISRFEPTPSGQEGAGPRYISLGAFLDDWDSKVKEMETALENQKAELSAAKLESDNRLAEVNAQISKITGTIEDAADAAAASSLENQKAIAVRLREEINTEIQKLENQTESIRSIYNEEREPFEGGYGLIAASEALHKLAAGSNIILGTLILVMLCLMFLDLTPLLIKLMKHVSGYDRYIAYMRNKPLTFAAPPGPVMDTFDYGTPQMDEPQDYPPPPQTRRTPPPPPPRPRR
jgi:hypothetical protein